MEETVTTSIIIIVIIAQYWRWNSLDWQSAYWRDVGKTQSQSKQSLPVPLCQLVSLAFGDNSIPFEAPAFDLMPQCFEVSLFQDLTRNAFRRSNRTNPSPADATSPASSLASSLSSYPKMQDQQDHQAQKGISAYARSKYQTKPTPIPSDLI